MTIAGHSFGVSGFCTLARPGQEQTCGKCFADIASMERTDVGKAGWAHYGNATETEYEEVARERERMWAAHQARDVAAG
jgi:hypothetical protein